VVELNLRVGGTIELRMKGSSRVVRGCLNNRSAKS